jgi:RecJ-like exonuclease
MGSCIICGTSVDGYTCSSHEEDVLFEFAGSRPGQLTPGRYYRGTVDGYADFGVFVDVGDSVTGLLHKSELDTRLESLGWEPGDTVYVQVTGVRDNGNVDLGWSIRQDEREFRGLLIDDPEGDRKPDGESGSTSESESDGGSGNAHGAAPDAETDQQSVGDGGTAPEAGTDPSVATRGESGDGGATAAGERAADEAAAAVEESAEADGEVRETGDNVTVESLDDRVGETVRLEGRVVSIRQTSGPTVFELRDETAAVECAAFVEAGVRAYPEVEVEDAVRLEGEVERRRGELQVETEALVRLGGDDAAAVDERLESAIDAEARPDEVALLADHDAVAAVEESLVEAATTVRRAVMEERPVLIRHTATADGYVAGAALERAVLPLLGAEHAREDAKYHYVERKPLDEGVYDMDAATDDATEMLDARERHDEQLPLVVLVDAGSTRESEDGYRLLDLYGADRIVVDANHPDEEVVDEVSTVVNPGLAGDATDVTTTALAANLAALVNDDVREEIAHLPAVSYWDDAPATYVDLAAEAGVDEDTARTLREAVALEAYYQSYSDKRQLVADVLFAPDRDLAGHVSEQFREKLDDELATARENLSTDEARGIEFAVLDTDAYTHRYDFPPTGLLLDELHRSGRADTDATLVTIGLDEDELHLRSTAPLDVRAVGEGVREREPEAGVRVVGGRDGKLEFLTGERAEVLDAAVAAVAAELA